MRPPAAKMLDKPHSTKTPNSLDEFGVISEFFTDKGAHPNAWPSQGVGDDCAFLDIGDKRIAVTTDMMALGTHFLDNADPYTVGRKSLAVNLSDLAAAGAVPKAFFLSISLPSIDEQWLKAYSKGLMEESFRYGCPLRGGDTVKAPVIDGKPSKITISITALGELPAGKGLTRSGAQPGDDIWVSGTPGDAFAALGDIWGYWKCAPSDYRYFKSRMDKPTARVALGMGLLNLASSSCDISDGLIGDLQHILDRSGVSAVLHWKDFPLSEAMHNMPEEVRRRCVLSGGDDYELLFTASAEHRARILELSQRLRIPATRIGEITSAGEPLLIDDGEGGVLSPQPSFNHFANEVV